MRLIGIAIVSVLATLAVVTFGPRRSQSGTSADLVSEGRTALKAITTLLMSADAGSVQGVGPAPLGADSIEFQLSGRASEISFEESGERCRVVWNGIELCQVAPYALGEAPNGMDDNGNGLIDERGLAFSLHQGELAITLMTPGRVSDQQQADVLVATVTLASLEEED